jgi:5'-nucleotidase
MVDYMAAFGTDPDVVDVDYAQNGVGVVFPADAPATYAPGDHVKFDVSSWSMTNAADLKDTAVTVKLGATTLGTATLDNTAQSALPGFDTTGKASVDVVVPATQALGPMTLTLVGADTGTETQVTLNVKANSTLGVQTQGRTFGEPVQVTVQVTASGASPTGTVTIRNGGTTLGTGQVSGGVATITIPAGVLPVGTNALAAEYSGDSEVNGSSATFSVTIEKASSTIAVKVKPKHPKKGHKVKLKITVAGANGVPATGTVTIKLRGKTVTVTLKNGKATAKLGKLAKGGKATVTYGGDANVAGSQATVKIKLKKKR